MPLLTEVVAIEDAAEDLRARRLGDLRRESVVVVVPVCQEDPLDVGDGEAVTREARPTAPPTRRPSAARNRRA